MWVVDEVTQILKEMLLEGNIHNIVVFTIITSSSVLSVVGAVRHIYTFIYNLRHGRQADIAQARAMYSKREDSQLELPQDFPLVVNLEKSAIINCNSLSLLAKSKMRKNQKKDKPKCTASQNASPTCLKCEQGMWERHCVYGLCQACCDKLGGCQGQGHERRPLNYDPWPNNWHRKARIIDLSHLQLEDLPPRLGFNHMDACGLDISYNCLTCLPGHITLMRGLVSFSAQHNLISHIPDFFITLHQLSCVDLRNNRLSTFPEPLLQLPQLLKLFLDHNNLREIPCDIDSLHFLQCLSLGHNNLTSIPDTLFNIHGLKSLSLRGNSKLSILPSGIGNLVCLQRLDVSRCDLCLIPHTLGSCSFLKKCNISYNRLSHLPCQISQCYRLELLDVSNNKLTYLPATLLFRQGVLTLKAAGNDFLLRPELHPLWLMLDTVIYKGQNLVPSLKTLVEAAVEKYELDPSLLPLPIQADLSAISSCFYCGKLKVNNSFRAIKFCQFAHLCPPMPSYQLQLHEFPFLHTFCRKHLHGNTPEALELCVETLSHSFESNKRL